MPVRKKYISVFTSLMITVIISCNNNKPDSSSEGSAKEGTSNLKPAFNPALGTWRDNSDTSHIIILTETQWLDYYNGEVVSANKVRYYFEPKQQNSKSDLSSEGSAKEETRNLIKLEESKNNFYHFEIVECDSFRLHLLHIEPGREMFFVRMDRQAVSMISF